MNTLIHAIPLRTRRYQATLLNLFKRYTNFFFISYLCSLYFWLFQHVFASPLPHKPILNGSQTGFPMPSHTLNLKNTFNPNSTHPIYQAQLWCCKHIQSSLDNLKTPSATIKKPRLPWKFIKNSKTRPLTCMIQLQSLPGSIMAGPDGHADQFITFRDINHIRRLQSLKALETLWYNQYEIDFNAILTTAQWHTLLLGAILDRPNILKIASRCLHVYALYQCFPFLNQQIWKILESPLFWSFYFAWSPWLQMNSLSKFFLLRFIGSHVHNQCDQFDQWIYEKLVFLESYCLEKSLPLSSFNDRCKEKK